MKEQAITEGRVYPALKTIIAVNPHIDTILHPDAIRMNELLIFLPAEKSHLVPDPYTKSRTLVIDHFRFGV
jgi:hypothetical protein